jgi:Skp family chaperone for outer membrane proteins
MQMKGFMAKSKFELALGVCLVLVAACLAFLWKQSKSSTPKIGYVDNIILIGQFNEAKKARKELEDFNSEWQKHASLLKDSMDLFMRNMGSEYNAASAGEKTRLRNLMQSKNEEMADFVAANQKRSQDKEKLLLDPVIKKINSYVQEYSEKNGYDIIFGSTVGGNIMAGGSKLNLTSEILRDLNAKYP